MYLISSIRLRGQEDRLEGCPLPGTSLLVPLLFMLIAPLSIYVVVAQEGCTDRRGSALGQHSGQNGGGEMMGDGLRGAVPRYPGLKNPDNLSREAAVTKTSSPILFFYTKRMKLEFGVSHVTCEAINQNIKLLEKLRK